MVIYNPGRPGPNSKVPKAGKYILMTYINIIIVLLDIFQDEISRLFNQENVRQCSLILYKLLFPTFAYRIYLTDNLTKELLLTKLVCLLIVLNESSLLDEWLLAQMKTKMTLFFRRMNRCLKPLTKARDIIEESNAAGQNQAGY